MKPSTLDELRTRAIEKLKTEGSLYLRDCSLCGYPLRYVWRNGQMLFDAGCDCMCAPRKLYKASFEELDFYLQQEPFLKEWGLL
jgi:hypothetical protein